MRHDPCTFAITTFLYFSWYQKVAVYALTAVGVNPYGSSSIGFIPCGKMFVSPRAPLFPLCQRYGVLSTYVQDFTSLGINLSNHFEISHLCEVLLENHEQPRNQRARVREPRLGARRQYRHQLSINLRTQRASERRQGLRRWPMRQKKNKDI